MTAFKFPACAAKESASTNTASQKFALILLAISDITVAIHFQFSIRAAVLTTIVYAGMYFIFVVKGYVNIV
ncbi:MAG: hypothetical protein RR826_06240, partial [Christensenellaceae bacterium]